MLPAVGPVKVRAPRDVAGTFEPQVVRKRQRRLAGVDDLVCRCPLVGVTNGEVAARLFGISAGVRIWTAARRLNGCASPVTAPYVAQVLAIGGRDHDFGSHPDLEGPVRP